MKAFGIRRKDWGCCPGHDKFAADTYNTNASQKAHTRDTKKAHRRGRLELKSFLRKLLSFEI